MKKQRVITKATDYNLGERIRFLRESRSLTQQALAKIAKVSQATIAHVEKNSKDPSVETLKKLAFALDIHIATLFAADDVFVFDMKRALAKKFADMILDPNVTLEEMKERWERAKGDKKLG